MQAALVRHICSVNYSDQYVVEVTMHADTDNERFAERGDCLDGFLARLFRRKVGAGQ